jgi:low affinity Fe/Cu permease
VRDARPDEGTEGGFGRPPLASGYRHGVTGPPEPDDVIADRRRQVRGTEEPEWRRGLIRGAPGGTLPAHGEGWHERHWSSRALHRLGEASAHAGAGLAAALAVLGWVAVGLATDFPDWWEKVLYASSSSVTLVMVFAIQHTQTRQQSATQRKLDELLRAQPAADDSVIAVEEAPDHELQARAGLNMADRRSAGGGGAER